MKPLRGLTEHVLHTVKRLLQAVIIRVEPIGQACNVLPSGLELFLGLLERAAHPDGRRRGALSPRVGLPSLMSTSARCSTSAP